MKENGAVTLKDRLIQSVQIAVFGLLALALTVLAVLEMIPTQGKGIQVEERLEVASFAVDSTGTRFVTSLHGSFKNNSNETIEVEKVRVLLSDGETRRPYEMKGFTLPARCEEPFELNFEYDVAVDTVVRVEAIVNGESVILENRDARASVSGALIFYLVLLIPVALLCLRAAKVRYYLYQEMRLIAEKM